jgi:hypothetical protein
MEKRERADFVARRAQLLARLFLQELGASVWVTAGDDGEEPFDSIAAFLTKDQRFRIIAIETQGTELPVGKEVKFPARLKWIRALQHSNVPVLFFVADVKRNQLFCGWARDVRCESVAAKGKQKVRCSLAVVPVAQAKEELLKTILAQPEFAERAGVG